MDLVPYVEHPEELLANTYNLIATSSDHDQAIMWNNGEYYIIADFPVGHVPAHTPNKIPL